MQPDIRWLNNGEPFSEQFQDYYFSTDGGFQESEYVFLKHNNFPERFYSSKDQPGSSLKIGETGFGTGLNFLVTFYFWQKLTQPRKSVHYIAVEKFPFSKRQLTRVYQTFCRQWPQLCEICNRFLDIYPETISEGIGSETVFMTENFKLSLLTGDAGEQLEQLKATGKHSFDAWYLDGFAPSKNPEMWTQTLFNSIYQLSKPGTTLSSFTAAGFVRRGLSDAGFTIRKAPGLGKKRENLVGLY